jgi:hypothetical protein
LDNSLVENQKPRRWEQNVMMDQREIYSEGGTHDPG